METRTDILCDILSSFDRDVIPTEFKTRFVDYPPPRLSPVSDSSLVRGSLPATIYHLACRDDAFYRCLQELVPPDVRAIQYYQTQSSRAQTALRRLSQYAETGPSAEAASNPDIDVPQCARQLRYIVYSMCEDRDNRIAEAPLSLQLLRRLAEILAKLVVQVVRWDRDRHQAALWQRNRPLIEHSREHNLFIYLIGDPPVDTALPEWMTDKFVIDRLRGFPPSEWSHLLELFTTIKDSIEDMDMDNLPGSFEYVAAINDMVQYYTATVYEPSSSSAQPRRA